MSNGNDMFYNQNGYQNFGGSVFTDGENSWSYTNNQPTSNLQTVNTSVIGDIPVRRLHDFSNTNATLGFDQMFNSPQSIAARSNLLPTAGEFVPRSYDHCTSPIVQNSSSSTNQGEPYVRRKVEKNSNNLKDKGKKLASNDFKQLQQRKLFSYNQETNGNRKSNWNPRVVEDSKSQGRQRLLAEAASMLGNSKPEHDVTPNSNNVSRTVHRETESARGPGGTRSKDNRDGLNFGNKSHGMKNDFKRVFTSRTYENTDLRPVSFSLQDYGKYKNNCQFFQSRNSAQTGYYQPSRCDKTANDASSDKKRKHNQCLESVNSVNGVNSFRSSPKKLDQHLCTKGDDGASQRERLTDQLRRGTLECLVCCESVRQQDAVWSCNNCFHVLHLRCIKKWAKSSKGESGWRCPACQNVSLSIPKEYRCFCGRVREPEWNRSDTPHTCGEMCGSTRERHQCSHRCTLLCHPGPCPPCVVMVTRFCGCGNTSQVVKCGSDQPLQCSGVCGKLLNCEEHNCQTKCHVGNCEKCEEIIKRECFCGKIVIEDQCTKENRALQRFACEGECGRQLDCGNHVCQQICHDGPCQPCPLSPSLVTHCPCGSTKLTREQQRHSCLDPIPTCENICKKKLPCGQPSNHHECTSVCHTGPCPSCPLNTLVRCRCGNMDKELPCVELKSRADDARCDKRCQKKRQCGKHKCNQPCCIEEEHICPLTCNHMLTCGLHRCELPCHRGNCTPCWRSSFEELYCECGSSVILPPVACGTRRPTCSQPCSRQHDCPHPPLHNCHSDPNCPPCGVLTQKYCYGKHELRKSIPCHLKEFSCGLPCGRELPCGRHRCNLPCHKGECLRSGKLCSQPCTTPRLLCGHICAAPCHEGQCPDSPCKEMVQVTCECGYRSTTRACADNAREYQRIQTSLLAAKIADMQMGRTIDITDVVGGSAGGRKISLKTLDCNDECKLIERNRRLAIGLQIRNPDLSAKLAPRYSDFMKQWGKKDPQFCTMVHDKLTELVQLAKQSKQKSRSYSFESMNRDKRHFIHEYCEHFGCESQAYDPEPNRNVVATAARDKAWLPGMSLLEVLQRENGQRKIPKPIISSNRTPAARTMDILPVKSSQSYSAQLKSAAVSEPQKQADETPIDYFDFS